MKIAYCIHSLHLFGGIERVLAIKANYLADVYGYEIHIITAALNGRKPHFWFSEKIQLHDVGISERFRPVAFRRRLDAILCDIRPDICVSVGGEEVFALPYCHDGSKKVSEFHFSHEKYYIKYGKNCLGKLYAGFRTRRMERIAASLDRFIVLTESDRKTWEKTVPGVINIYNPLTFSSNKTATLDNKTCIAVGRLEKQKNFKDLVVAWKEVAQQFPDWVLEIYGNGSLKEALSRQIRELSLEGKVKLMGSSSDIHARMLESSCLAMSSIYEGFPMVLLEAAETGLPMVSYNCSSGPDEIIVDGRNGYLVELGNTGQLARRLCAVLADQTLRREFGENAKSTAARFSQDRIMSRWKEVFEDIVKK